MPLRLRRCLKELLGSQALPRSNAAEVGSVPEVPLSQAATRVVHSLIATRTRHSLQVSDAISVQHAGTNRSIETDIQTSSDPPAGTGHAGVRVRGRWHPQPPAALNCGRPRRQL